MRIRRQNYYFNPGEFPEIGKRDEATNDDFLFRQGTTKGLGRIQFHDYNLAYSSVSLSNVEVFRAQIEVLKEFLFTATPSEEQDKDIDYLPILGELFSLVAYGQLILENSRIYGLGTDLVDQIFDVAAAASSVA